MNDPTVIYIPGPSGPSGPVGPSGSVGPRGYEGSDGHGIYSGKGPPPNELGTLGDFWLDNASYVLYGPRVSQTVWPAQGQTLLGPPGPAGRDGADGADGAAGPAGLDGTSAWVQGDGPPPVDNDFAPGTYYFDRANKLIYPPAE